MFSLPRRLRKALPLMVALATAGILLLAAEVARVILMHRASNAAEEEISLSLDRDASMVARRLAARIADLAMLKNIAESELAMGGGFSSRGKLGTAMDALLSAQSIYHSVTFYEPNGKVSLHHEPPLSLSGPSKDIPLLAHLREEFQEALDADHGTAVIFPVLFLEESASGKRLPLLLLSSQVRDSEGRLRGILHLRYRLDFLLGDLFATDSLGRMRVLVDPAGQWAIESRKDGSWRLLDPGDSEILSSAADQEIQLRTDGWFRKDGGTYSARQIGMDSTLLTTLPKLRIIPPGRLDWILLTKMSRQTILDHFGAQETGVWLVTLVAMALLVPASFLGTRYSLAAAMAEEQLNKVINCSQHGIIALQPDKTGHCLSLERINQAAMQFLGIAAAPPDECPAHHFLPKDILGWVEEVILSGIPATKEYQRDAEHGPKWLYLRAAKMGDGAVLSLADISGRKADEEALRESERSLRQTAEIGKLGSWSVEYPDRKLHWSPEVRRLHAVGEDYQPDLSTAMDFYLPSSRERIVSLYVACEKDGSPFDSEFEFRDASGKLRWVRAIGEAEYDPATKNLKRIFGAFQDLTETHAALVALNESRERLELAFWGGGMSSLDWEVETGKINFDKRWAEVLGYGPQETQESLEFWDSLIPDDDRAKLHEARKLCLGGQEATIEAEYRMRGKDGGCHWVLERSRVVEFNLSGTPGRIAGVVIDITKLKETESRLEEAVAHEKELAGQAQAAAKAKRDFLAVMSHEIRTPMNSILGFAELLAEANLDANELDYVKTIQQSGESLLRIINDILEFTRIDSGRMPLEHTPLSLREVVQATQSLLEHSASAKGIVLRTQVEASVPEIVLGDAGRLKQVLVNLVANAIKFTSKGSVSLGLDAAEREGLNHTVTFAVSDTGCGIPEAKLQQIFLPFTQVDASSSRQQGGTGLGLSIAKLLVELMGGEMYVESTQGEGSTFSFSIPFEVQTPDKKNRRPGSLLPPDDGAGSAAEDTTLKILVAEDDRVNSRLTRLVLQKLGYSTTMVTDGRAALEAASAIAPDIILMDIHMPQMDGIKATQLIRKLERETPSHKKAFIIAFTADILPVAQEACLSAGMDEFLSKPLSIPRLRAILAKAAEHLSAKRRCP